MRSNFRTILSISFAIFWMAAANHCVLEEFLSLRVAHAEEQSKPIHLPHHPGHDTPHQHDEQKDSHTHGQPCPLSVLVNAKSLAELHLGTEIIVPPLIFVSFLFSCLNTEVCTQVASLSSRDKWKSPQWQLLSSLQIASNAPPSLA